LRQLNAFGANVPVRWDMIKDCGPDTTERLKARGFFANGNARSWSFLATAIVVILPKIPQRSVLQIFLSA
jgi:hypothetical protein